MLEENLPGADQARNILKKVAQHLNYYGLLAIEFFVTPDKKLLVNEIAPRVHNSGHYTQLATNCSQFENHLRAISDMKLIKPKTFGTAIMWNLLGPAHFSIEEGSPMPFQEMWVKDIPKGLNISLHWYGKKDIRPGRKVGHINILLNNSNDIDKALKWVQQRDELWINSFSK